MSSSTFFAYKTKSLGQMYVQLNGTCGIMCENSNFKVLKDWVPEPSC